MSRTLPTVVLTALVSTITVWTLMSSAGAQELPPPQVYDVECTPLVQHTGAVDEAFVERFMSDQIALGRKRFESVRGITTLLCAW